MAKGKNIRRSLGLGKIYNVRKMSLEDEHEDRSLPAPNLHGPDFTEDRLHPVESLEDSEDLVPPEVPERDYEVLHFDYIPPSPATLCISPSRDSSPTSTLDETTSSNFSCCDSSSSSSSTSSPSRRSLSPTLRLKHKVEKAKFTLTRTLVKTFSHNT